MSKKKTVDRTVALVAVVGSLVLVNILGLALFTRFDLTRDQQFTLSQATRDVLRNLHEPVTVRAYFTKDLPPPHAANARYVRDLLDEYFTYGHGKFRYEIVDPLADESAEDKEKKKDVKQDIFGRQIREPTAMERELAQAGIPPVQVQVNEEDKLEVKRAYMGIVVNYGDKKQVIPMVTKTTGLEYDLTTLIRKLTRDQASKVGIVQHDGLSPQTDYPKAWGALGELYDMSMVDLTAGPVAIDIDALLIVGPKAPFTDQEKRYLDGYLTSGKSVGFLLGPVKPNLQNLQSEDNRPELQDLLANYGVTLNPGLVLDTECATINVAQQAGFMRINQPVKYPFIPVAPSLENHTITRGLAQVAFPFTSPVEVKVPEGSGLQHEILVRTSPLSWVRTPPFNLDPMQRWEPPTSAADAAARPLVVTLAGTFKSAYGSAAATSTTPAEAAQGRMFVIGGATLLTDPFFGKANETFVLNLVDWLVRDDNLLAVRSRGLAPATFAKLDDTKRNLHKYLNMLGLPAAFVAFGLMRWRWREGRRSKIVL